VTLLDQLRAALPLMVTDLAALVGMESPSADHALTTKCADHVAAWVADRVADRVGVAPERHVIDGVTHLRWQFGGPTQVLLLGHLDTVWPAGTLARWPFQIRPDGTATGPGIFDMKSGLVQMVHALTVLPTLAGITLLITADEEVGSTTSAALIEETARGARAALVAESPKDGALKVERKGTGTYHYDLTGRAAHAGLEPERGRNALIAAANLLLAAAGLADPARGTTVTPTVLAAGTTTNTVPAKASLAVDVRATTIAEQHRVDAALRALPTGVEGVSYDVTGGINRAPLEAASSAGLFALAEEVAASLGLPPLRGVAVGGGSDGNITAGVGIPTLDGLGALGDGAHAEGECIVIDSLVERTALLAGLIARLQG
jgi:glutamate carboxypeptidase